VFLLVLDFHIFLFFFSVVGKMVFIVKSAVNHGPSREIIRRTWASLSYVEGFQFTSIFVLGQTNAKQQALIYTCTRQIYLAATNLRIFQILR